MGPGSSPSRARRVAVTWSVGIPALPQVSSDWLTPARRKSAWSVRTCWSSPVWDAAMTASSAPGQAQVVRGTRLDERDERERLDRGAQRDLDRPGRRWRARCSPVALTWTTWPRCRLSTMSPRRTSTSTGGGTLRGIARDRSTRSCGWRARPRRRRVWAPRRWYRAPRGPRPRLIPCGRGRPSRLPDAPRLDPPRGAAQARAAARRRRPSPRSSGSWCARSAGWWATRRSRTHALAPVTGPDPAGGDRGQHGSPTASASCPSCGPAWAWSTRCWS